MGPNEQQWLNQVRSLDRKAFSDKLRHNLPDWLAGALRAELDEEEFWKFVESMAGSAPLDTARQCAEGAPGGCAGAARRGRNRVDADALFAVGPARRRQARAAEDGGVRPRRRRGAGRGQPDPLRTRGAQARRDVVDFCAGAGGKTLAHGAAMRSTGRLYAFDVSGHRLDKLKPRLARSGLSNVYPAQLTNERDDRVKRLAGKIDRVLVDAPCSGLGTLRRNPDLKWRHSARASTRCASCRGASSRAPPGC
jgi:16S rRNA (cytosine967-C5)-methyltransferase